jgi:hypothetical protein
MISSLFDGFSHCNAPCHRNLTLCRRNGPMGTTGDNVFLRPLVELLRVA